MDFALLGRPLISEAVEAWPYGPVYPELYDSLRRYGSGPVIEMIRERDTEILPETRDPVVRAMLSKEEALVKCCLAQLSWEKRFSAFQYDTSAGYALDRNSRKIRRPYKNQR